MSLVDDHASQYRAYILTPTDRRGMVVIAAALLMSWMVLLFLIRLYTRLGMNGPLGVDDLLTGIGTVCLSFFLSSSLFLILTVYFTSSI